MRATVIEKLLKKLITQLESNAYDHNDVMNTISKSKIVLDRSEDVSASVIREIMNGG